jgi:DNA-binding NarL/FixJ family response regulator
VLACAQGGSNIAVAARLGVDRKTVRRTYDHIMDASP